MKLKYSNLNTTDYHNNTTATTSDDAKPFDWRHLDVICGGSVINLEHWLHSINTLCLPKEKTKTENRKYEIEN